MVQLKQQLKETATLVDQELARLLDPAKVPNTKIFEAMKYGVLNGGKRLRPFLVVQGAVLFSVSSSAALHTAAALEMVHSYSLIHDDLPAMDNDDLRRGKPTTHIAFDESTAILAGDGLLTLAFEILAHESTHPDPTVRLELISELASASGAHGMIAGQMIDLDAHASQHNLHTITQLQHLKTGKLFDFACLAGAILGKASQHQRQSLHHFAHDLGLAFQIADDILDATGDEEKVGKRVNKDHDLGKATFVEFLGIERAKEQAIQLSEQAIGHLNNFDERADILREVPHFVIERQY